MAVKNGGIIGPANTPTGGLAGVAKGVWRLADAINFTKNGTWPTVPTPVTNTCRFDDGSTDYLTTTFGSAGNRDTFTLSAWVKRANISLSSTIFGGGADDNNRLVMGFQSDDSFAITDVTSGVGTTVIDTNRLFRDVGAWYHIVVAYDTTQSTDSDRVKLYVNGVQETSFASTNYPSQNTDQHINGAVSHFIGSNKPVTPSNYYDGYMSEVVFIDGLQLDASYFGETNATTNIWVPKPIGGQVGSFGTNGFYLGFADSSNLGKDLSGNSNNFTVNNLTSIDQTTDTPANNWCTMNPFITRSGTPATYSEGNLKVVWSHSVNVPTMGTIGVQSGKWYYESKMFWGSNSYIGITYDSVPTNTDVKGYLLRQTGEKYDAFTGSASSYTSALSTGDTVMIAFDADNGTLWFGVNGTWSNSATQAEIENGTTTNAAFSSIDMSYIWLPMGKGGISSNARIEANFGNPIYTISSGNSDANGYGNFEYAVPSGYYALNSANLNTYG